MEGRVYQNFLNGYFLGKTDKSKAKKYDEKTDCDIFSHTFVRIKIFKLFVLPIRFCYFYI